MHSRPQIQPRCHLSAYWTASSIWPIEISASGRSLAPSGRVALPTQGAHCGHSIGKQSAAILHVQSKLFCGRRHQERTISGGTMARSTDGSSSDEPHRSPPTPTPCARAPTQPAPSTPRPGSCVSTCSDLLVWAVGRPQIVGSVTVRFARASPTAHSEPSAPPCPPRRSEGKA